jgi:hypothetical protein
VCRQPHKDARLDLTEEDYAQMLDELDRLLNDPDVPMQPAVIWRLGRRGIAAGLASRH